MGVAHTRMLHSELVEHWQRVVGNRGPRSPRLGPMEPITQSCQRTDSEPLNGGRGPEGKLASEGFAGFPHPLSFPSRGKEKRLLTFSGTSRSQCHFPTSRIQNIPAIATGSLVKSAFTALLQCAQG